MKLNIALGLYASCACVCFILYALLPFCFLPFVSQAFVLFYMLYFLSISVPLCHVRLFYFVCVTSCLFLSHCGRLWCLIVALPGLFVYSSDLFGRTYQTIALFCNFTVRDGIDSFTFRIRVYSTN